MSSEFTKPDSYASPLFASPLIVYEYRPGHLYMNITNRCTNACIFCSLRHRGGRLGPFNLNLAGLPRAPLRVHPEAPDRHYPVDARACSPEWISRVLDMEPAKEEILEAFDAEMASSDRPVEEVVFCGAGEPLIRLNTVQEVCRYLKKAGLRVRVNTNGQAGLIHGKKAVEMLSDGVDEVSISLNAHDAETYAMLSRPAAGREAFDALLDFTGECVKRIDDVTLSIVGLSQGECGKFGVLLDVEACRGIANKVGAFFRIR